MSRPSRPAAGDGGADECSLGRSRDGSAAGLPGDGVAVSPGDAEPTPIWRALAGERRRVEFGFGDDCRSVI